jgi:hypothetical protein
MQPDKDNHFWRTGPHFAAKFFIHAVFSVFSRGIRRGQQPEFRILMGLFSILGAFSTPARRQAGTPRPARSERQNQSRGQS